MPATARITLIRRDPASGSQWNVGRLIQRNAGARDNPLRQIDIELNSPGYTKFAQLRGSVPREATKRFHRMVDQLDQPKTTSSLFLPFALARHLFIQQWSGRAESSMSAHVVTFGFVDARRGC
jgi:hypothetical protein